MSLNLIKPALWLNCFAYAYAFKLVIKVTIQEAIEFLLSLFLRLKFFHVNILTMP